MTHLPAPVAASNPRAVADEAADRAQRIARRVASLTLGASAVMDSIRVRRIGLGFFEIDGGTIIDTAGVVAEVTYLAEERLGLNEVPVTLAGQRIEAQRVAVTAAGRMLRRGVPGHYELAVAAGRVVARWDGDGAPGDALAILVRSLAGRGLAGTVVGHLIRLSAPAQREVA